jgi:hypothetical protein
LKGEIDTSFETLQRDLFASGMAAVIGPNAFVVWLAIKAHADNNTGVCWPSVRKLAEVTGLSSPTVQKCLKTLTDANLLRVASGGKGTRSTRYVARERMTVRIGDQVICVIAIDYVPSFLRRRLDALSEAIKTGSSDPEAFATCDIIPADGFVWDNDSKTLRKRIAVKDLPRVDDTDVVGEIETALSQRVKELEGNAKKRKSR